MRYTFETFELDADTDMIARSGERIDIKGVSLVFVKALLQSAPYALTLQQLAQQVWKRQSITIPTVKKRVTLVHEILGADIIKVLDDGSCVIAVQVEAIEGCSEERPTAEAKSKNEASEPIKAPSFHDVHAHTQAEVQREKPSTDALVRRAMIVGGVFMALVLVSILLQGS